MEVARRAEAEPQNNTETILKQYIAMEDLKYIPFYLDWIELMRTKDTDAKKVAFFDAIVDYALKGTVPPAPANMDDPHGIDYARRDGYLVSNKQLDYILPKIKGGASGKGVSRNVGNQHALKQNRNNTETILLNKSKDKNKSESKSECVNARAEEARGDGEGAIEPYGVNCRPATCPTDEEMEVMAGQVGIPKSFIPQFVKDMEGGGWGYVNSGGNYVQLHRRNFKSILRSFYNQHVKNQEKEKSGGKPSTTKGVVHHDPNYKIHF